MNHGPPKLLPVLPAWLSPLSVSVLVNQKPFPFATRTGHVLIVHSIGMDNGQGVAQNPTYRWNEAEESWRKDDFSTKSRRKSDRDG